jgi:hypothetical protein
MVALDVRRNGLETPEHAEFVARLQTALSKPRD